MGFTFGEAIVRWPTILSVVRFPVIVGTYTWPALEEEREMTERFGDAYREQWACADGHPPEEFAMTAQTVSLASGIVLLLAFAPAAWRVQASAAHGGRRTRADPTSDGSRRRLVDRLG